MCYMVYLATDCPDDFSCKSSDLVRFTKLSGEACSKLRNLNHEHKWFVGSQSGCSCTFRHLCRESVGLGFRAPENWFPEKQDAIDATLQLYDILKEIVQRRYQVELLDCWSGDEDEDALFLDVSLTAVSSDHFRLFERHVFHLLGAEPKR